MSSGPRSKYFGEQDPRYGGNLHWPGNGAGVPFRSDGGTPLLKQHEYSSLQVVGDFHVALLNLSDAEQLANYIWIMDRAVNHLFRINFVQRFWDPARCSMLVYIEWTQMTAQLPPRTGGPNGQLV